MCRNGGGKMALDFNILIIIIGGMIVTALPRILPIAILSQMELPSWFMNWLKFIPIAILTAILVQELVPLGEGETWNPNHLFATVVSFIVGFWTKSLLWTVIAGVGTVVALNSFF
ncbi:AzlD domain-containing protein [Planococcaceae bacterium Storch 2/2-2]|nr:AzlD domain-containing protein [Planococcaceae bacterium Storch 2/2-2]